jgi:hypothetical protein
MDERSDPVRHSQHEWTDHCRAGEAQGAAYLFIAIEMINLRFTALSASHLCV